MTNRRFLTAFATLWLALGGVLLSTMAGAQKPAAQRATLPRSARTDSVDTFIRRVMREREIPGLQLAVVQHGRVVLESAYGVANVEHQVPVTRRTVFPIASATKSFTGVAVLQLAERGLLHLSAPIARYVDSLPLAWQSVTLRQLLTHTSGLPNIVDQVSGSLIVPGEKAAWARVISLPPEGAPGVRFSYNQTNYLLLGRAIEHVTGQAFTALVSDRQFRPVEMRAAGFSDSRDVVPHGAQSYTYMRIVDGKELQSDTLALAYAEYPRGLRTAAGIHSSAGDIARWIIALQRGRLISDSSLTMLWTPGTLNDGTRIGYALGWPVIERERHRALAGIGGGRAAFFVYPDDDLAVVILTNLQGGAPHVFIDTVAAFFVPGIGQH